MKKLPASKRKKPQVIQKSPTVTQSGKEFDLREQGSPGQRIVEFPQMKGREVQTVHFHSNADENTISIAFRDRHVFSFHFEPALVLTSSLLKLNRRDTDTIKEWPSIHSEPRNPETQEP